MEQNRQESRPQTSLNGSHLRLRAKLVRHLQAKESFSWPQIYLTFSVSYLQLFFMTTRFLRDYAKSDSSALRAALKYLEDVITFDNLFDYSRGGVGVYLTVFVILGYFIILFTSFWALRKSVKNIKKPHYMITAIWSFINQFQNPIIFFMINNLCARIQKTYMDDRLNVFDLAALNQGLFGISIVILVLNIVISFCLDLLLCHALPTENPMASKNSYTDRITLFQKLILTLLWRFLPRDSFTNWLLITLNLAISFIKHWSYYYTFPRYNIRVLKFNAYMLTVEGSIVFMAFLVSLLNDVSSTHISLTSTIMIIVLLLPFLIVCIRGLVNRCIIKILYALPNQLNPSQLMHRLILLNEIKSYRDQKGEDENHISRNWLHFTSISSHRKTIFKEEDEDILNGDFADRGMQIQTIRQFLERAFKRHSHNSLVTLTLIKFYVKPLRLLPLAIAHLAKISSYSFRDRLSIDLLYLEIEETISKYYTEADTLLDMTEYLSTMKQFERFEEKIKTQLQLHRNFWVEYSKNHSDTFKLYQLSEKIAQQKKMINSEWSKTTFNKEYSQPYLLYACYLLTLDDSPQKAQQYTKTHNLFNQRDKDDQDSQELTRKNMYSEENFYITITTDVERIGQIVQCSQSIQRVLKYDPKSLIDTNINQLMSSYIAHNHNQFILNYVKTGKAKFMNKIQSIFIKDKQGFLQKASVYAKVHPFFSQEIFLTAMIKPIKTTEEYILVTPQGQIDSTTSGIAKRLGIQDKKISMASVCPEFEKLNEVYNHLGYKSLNKPHEKNIKTEHAKSKNELDDEGPSSKIYEKWSLEGGDLKFTSSYSDSASQVLTCFCQIHNYQFAADFIKVIIIKDMKINNQSLIHIGSKALGYQTPKMKDHLSVAFADEDSFDFGEINEHEKVKEIPKSYKMGLNSPHGSVHTTQGLLTNNYPSGLQYTGTHGSYIIDDKALLHTQSPINAKKYYVKKHNDTNTINSFEKFETKLGHHDNSAVSTSAITSQATKNRVYTVISEALQTKSYTKPAYMFLFLCLCLAAALFGSQLALQEKVRSDLNTLEALGTTLDYANTGVDALIYLSRGARISYLGQVRIIDVVTSPAAANYVKAFGSALSVYLPILANSNSGLWSSLQKIDATFRNHVLAPNIQFFEFYPNLTVESYRSVNTLTGTVLLENQLLRMKTYYTQNGMYDPLDLIYIMRNGVNGLPVENKNLADIVLAYIKTSIEDQHISLNILFVTGLVIIVFCLCLVLVCSYRFYHLETKRLNLFARLSEQEVRSIQENISQLEETLKSQEYDFTKLCCSSQLTDNKGQAKSFGGQMRNKQNFRLLNTRSLQKAYFLKIFYWVLILGIYATFIIVIYTRVYQNGSNFENGVNRLIAVQRFLEHIQICVLGVYAMFIPQYEPTLETIPTLTLLKQSLDALSHGATDLTEAYKLSDGTLDPVIKPIFSSNICDFLSASDLPRCLLISPGAKVKDLFTVISALYTEISFGLESVLDSDQSYDAFQAICTRTFVNVSPIAFSLRSLFLKMISQARDNFNNIYATLLDHLDIFLAINIVLFFTLVAVAWIFVIRYLMSYNNRMKTMLSVIPIRVFMTNKSLKSLLTETCQDKIQTIKNEF